MRVCVFHNNTSTCRILFHQHTHTHTHTHTYIYSTSSLKRSRKINRSYSFARRNDVTYSSSEVIFAEREPEESVLINVLPDPNYIHSFRWNKIEETERKWRRVSATPPRCHSTTQSLGQCSADRNTNIFKGKEPSALRCLGMSDRGQVHRIRQTQTGALGFYMLL